MFYRAGVLYLAYYVAIVGQDFSYHLSAGDSILSGLLAATEPSLLPRDFEVKCVVSVSDLYSKISPEERKYLAAFA